MAFWERKPVDGKQQAPPVRRVQPQDAGVLAGRGPDAGPATSSQLAALQQLSYLSAEQGSRTIHQDLPPDFAQPHMDQPAPAPRVDSKDSIREQGRGRHHSSPSRTDDLLRRHGARFASFSVIGGGIFVAGLLLQAVLTSGLRVPSLISYIVQAVISVEASYLLNRWFTWKGVKAPFWGSFLRYNLQKAVTVTANFILYGLLLKLGVQYLLDNVLLTIVFTFVNYIGADKLVFLRGSTQMIAALTGPLPVVTGPISELRPDRKTAGLSRRARRDRPSVSVVIPVRSNEKTIRAAVDSILGQDYPLFRELILVGSPGDSTWAALRGINDPRLFVMETETPSGIRDANFKRDFGIRQTSGELLALIDSDMVLPPDWLSRAVWLLQENEVDCVAGVMRSIRDDFWGRFVDRNRLGAKTPRANSAYLVTADGFGAAGFKPPITADILFTRKMYEDCPIDSSWSHGSLEDYEWFWRVVQRGHQVLVSDELYGWHHHRAGLKNLAREYRRSARGCAFFIRTHRDSPFAQKRMTQAIVLPLAVFGLMLGIAAAAYMHHGKLAMATFTAVALAGLAFFSIREFARSRTLESLAYPIPALALGMNYTASLAANLIRSASVPVAAAIGESAVLDRETPLRYRMLVRRLLHPLTFILAFQAATGLILVWSNTGFADELDYLWVGTTLINNLMHGTAWPTAYAHSTLSGLPFFYPPLGALANTIGGLAGARILSLIFMLCSTGFVYATGKRLYGQAVAACSAAFWVTYSPALQLGAFATYDAMSVSLTACAAWLVTRTAASRRRGESVLCAGIVLAAAEVTAYSGIVMIPVVVMFALVIWIPDMGIKGATIFTAWLAGVTVVTFGLIMTIFKTWPGIMHTVLARNVGVQGYATPIHVFNDSWTYGGIIAVFAFLGTIYAFSLNDRKFVFQTCYLSLIAFVIPLAQAHETTAVSLRKHLAYGGMFAAIAAGYGLSRLAKSLPAKRWAAFSCCALAFVIPASDGILQAHNWFRSWQDGSALQTALMPLISSHPEIAVSLGDGNYLCDYLYAGFGDSWQTKCHTGLTVNDVRAARSKYLVLGYPASVGTTDSLPPSLLLSPDANQYKYLQFLGVELGVSNTQRNPLLAQITLALETSGNYRLIADGPFDDAQSATLFTIWQRVRASNATATKAVSP
jgi:glycosyltransferase involved in cell wall biosynthesis/putative flippase GtrA